VIREREDQRAPDSISLLQIKNQVYSFSSSLPAFPLVLTIAMLRRARRSSISPLRLATKISLVNS
jgi:hypothetical protein